MLINWRRVNKGRHEERHAIKFPCAINYQVIVLTHTECHVLPFPLLCRESEEKLKSQQEWRTKKN